MNWPSRFNLSSKLGAWLDRLLDKAKRSEIVESSHVRVVPSSHGTQLYIKPQGGGSGTGSPGVYTRYQIVSVEGDYLTARRQQENGAVDPTETPEFIAKPHFLRVSVLNGLNADNWSIAISSPGNVRTLTALTGAGVTVGRIVTQRMNYPYAVGNVIYAIKAIGKTSVDHPTLGSPNQIEWLDTNVDARNFHQTRIELNACVLVGGVPTTKVIVFEAGPVP